MNTFVTGEGKDNIKLQNYLREWSYSIPGNFAWSLRCPRYHPELCEEGAALLHAGRQEQEQGEKSDKSCAGCVGVEGIAFLSQVSAGVCRTRVCRMRLLYGLRRMGLLRGRRFRQFLIGSWNVLSG